MMTADSEKVRFLQNAMPFGRLQDERVSWLASRLEEVGFSAGSVVIREGERGDSCYLVCDGELEVVINEADCRERTLATLGSGALFGEAALLHDGPRNATVRALTEAKLLILHRADLLEAMRNGPAFAGDLLDLLRTRDRPRRRPGIATSQRVSSTGERMTILTDLQRRVYFRLSSQARFLWDRMDDRHTLRDLTVEFLYEFKTFSPQLVTETVRSLAIAGFLEVQPLTEDLPVSDATTAWWQRTAARAARILEWRVMIRNVDAVLTWMYDAGISGLFTAGGQAILAAVAIAGICIFCFSGGCAIRSLELCSDFTLLVFLVPAWILTVILHEAGHAFTVKTVGCHIGGAGVGWYWFSPVAFVDTSDLWRAERRERIAVSIAGPYASVLAGSVAVLWSSIAPNSMLAPLLCQVALLSYIQAVLNLNPLLEYDGYYVLMDWLEAPNLRSHAFRTLRDFRSWRTHRLELVYAAASLLYIGLVSRLTVALYRTHIQAWVSHWLPRALASGLARVPAMVLTVLIGFGVLYDIQRSRRGPHEKWH